MCVSTYILYDVYIELRNYYACYVYVVHIHQALQALALVYSTPGRSKSKAQLAPINLVVLT